MSKVLSHDDFRAALRSIVHGEPGYERQLLWALGSHKALHEELAATTASLERAMELLSRLDTLERRVEVLERRPR